jgi:hypothetical protein
VRNYNYFGAPGVPTKPANIINHIALVLDASSSMHYLRETVIKVADAQIAHLAVRSQELKQETRITVYLFADQAQCVIFDMDVLRLPSMRELYEPHGNTALIAATILSQEDLARTAQMYGDHSFLTYVLTDGYDNRSVARTAELKQLLASQADNWTVAALVPDASSVYQCKKLGFPEGNIQIWDVTTVQGVVEVGETIMRATDIYMTSRATGVRGTKTLFADASVINTSTVNAKKLKPLDRDAYTIFDVKSTADSFVIKDFVTNQGHTYLLGKAYYQLSKTETIQPQKLIAIQNIHSGRIYTGEQARTMLGLGDQEVRVKPELNPEYRIFVQSTSVNRKLVARTKLLLLK